ncbi:Protein of unknown function [Saccharopolyspora kobensis]|uniref:DUF4232 domain-containing protein n=1 Tax=Saccharopolyspora kobensis TaxID=146035 RepID=A0A1H6D5W3_9PSEU|nr:DUF4232 domain-containing protein [Saccharopolyspora kobensis]SEG80710.1 Protein of unknown function [Saccharopolyspora kobensis]SFD12983.1 Protein of unknown function [Saccharopolyspora kobensis]
MTAHRLRTIGVRTLQASGALLVAGLMAGCGQAAPAGQAISAPLPQSQPEPPSAVVDQNLPAEQPGTPTTENSAAPPPEAPKPKTDEVTRCHTSMLTGSLQNPDAGAGQRYAELTLTNSSGETCTLYGYGGMQLVDASGRPLPTDAKRTPNPGPSMITLSPGESASATLHWTAVPHEGEPTDGPCAPTAASLQVIPPDETDPLPVTWNGGPVCGFGKIDGTAYHQ